jgi:insulysin
VHQDAANIKVLTKAEMITFFKEFIDPTSPRRSKLAIHLIAQVSAPSENGDILPVNGDSTLAKIRGNDTTPYVIKDVREFKSMLQVSRGPQPVKCISEFEELDSKL